MSAPSRVVNVLDEDRDLAQQLSGARFEHARRNAVARVIVAQPGAWSPPAKDLTGIGTLGLLVLSGVLARHVSMDDRPGVELFGSGDLLRPFEEAEVRLLRQPAAPRWWALLSTRLAILDARFTTRMADYPEVIDELAGRLERRSSTHALRFAIMQQPHLAQRLQLLLWHLADRFGHVHSEGVVVPIRLSHELLAQLVGARRPSVSRALKELERAHTVARRRDGSWVLRGQPPMNSARSSTAPQQGG